MRIAMVLGHHGFKSCLSPELFSAFLCNCINCIHNCEDHSSFKDIFIKYLGIVNIHF